MRGAAVKIAVISAPVVAFAFVASQAPFGAGSEGGTLVADRGASGAVAAEHPPGNRLLPGDVRAPDPREPGGPLTGEAQKAPAVTQAGVAPPAPDTVPASFRSPERRPLQAEADPQGTRGEHDGDEPGVVIPEMMARARAAVRQVLVGGVTEVEREGAWYEVEFDSSDDDVEVVLDQAFNLIVAELDEDDRAPTAAQVEEARVAARAMAELGDVVEVEREDEGYEVEFSSPDGTDIEVRLDLNLNLVAVEVESD